MYWQAVAEDAVPQPALMGTHTKGLNKIKKMSKRSPILAKKDEVPFASVCIIAVKENHSWSHMDYPERLEEFFKRLDAYWS